MECVAGGAGVRHASATAVTSCARFTRGQQNVAGIPARGRGVTLHAFHAGVTRVIELAVVQPAFGHYGGLNLRTTSGAGFHLVTIRATGVCRGSGPANGSESTAW